MFNYFHEIAKILKDYVDIFYLDVLCSIKEIKIALEASKEFNKQVLVGGTYVMMENYHLEKVLMNFLKLFKNLIVAA